jgi:CheY-like chemotaxis protein
MKTDIEQNRAVPDGEWDNFDVTSIDRTTVDANVRRVYGPIQLRDFALEDEDSAGGRRKKKTPSIYVVDDDPSLTELYTDILEATGYQVEVFNDRAKALEALKTDESGPDLLIMDYLGHDLPAERFIQGCLSVQPALPILIASGISQFDERFVPIDAIRFIEKPFSIESFQEEVSAALAA